SVTALKEPCDGSADARNAHETDVVTPVTPVTPLPGDAGERGAKPPRAEPPIDEPGLSRFRIRELADWYMNETHRRYSKNQLDTGELDSDLRVILREEVVFPEHIEIEFERVMQVAFAI